MRLQTPPRASRPQPIDRTGVIGPSSFGYIVASACIMSAALILILVYFLAMGLATPTTSNGQAASPVPPIVSPSPSLPTPIATSTSALTPTPFATPSDLPADEFITQAETASAVDIATSKAINLTTIFSVNRKVYIILHVHPTGQLGAICLLWYLNGKETTQFSFSIFPGETDAYSYTIYRQAGIGSVDVYWASSTSCTHKSLAQHVVFTVTA